MTFPGFINPERVFIRNNNHRQYNSLNLHEALNLHHFLMQHMIENSSMTEFMGSVVHFVSYSIKKIVYYENFGQK